MLFVHAVAMIYPPVSYYLSLTRKEVDPDWSTRKKGWAPFNAPWREAGPPNHHDDKVDSDQQVVNQ